MKTRVRSAIKMPGKINLYLAVENLRDDGYHEVKTLLHSVNLYDTIRVTSELYTSNMDHPVVNRTTKVTLTHDAGPSVPTGDDNLAVQAAYAIADHANFSTFLDTNDPAQQHTALTEIVIEKNIPVAGGMAGGSADAAAVLLILNQLWGLEYSTKELERIGANLGADIPFCLYGKTAIGTGSGTELSPLLNSNKFCWVVGTMGEELSTPRVFKTLDEMRADQSIQLPSTPSIDAAITAVSHGDTQALALALHNDLQPAAIALLPQIQQGLDALTEAGALRAIVSGSGPTVIGLAKNREHAKQIKAAIAGDFQKIYLCSSTNSGPDWL